jgi:hypothetical protein
MMPRRKRTRAAERRYRVASERRINEERLAEARRKHNAGLAAPERTAAEYRSLLGQAGFRMTRVVQTASPLSRVEARTA